MNINETQATRIFDTLNTLAMILTEEGHKWTRYESELFDKTITILSPQECNWCKETFDKVTIVKENTEYNVTDIITYCPFCGKELGG